MSTRATFDGVRVRRTRGAGSENARGARVLSIDGERGHPGWLLVGQDVVTLGENKFRRVWAVVTTQAYHLM